MSATLEAVLGAAQASWRTAFHAAVETAPSPEQALGSFERAERAVDLLLDAGDETIAALEALRRAPERLAHSFRLGGLVRLPGISWLGQLQHGLAKLASRVVRRLTPQTYVSTEGDIERISRKLRRVSAALTRLG